MTVYVYVCEKYLLQCVCFNTIVFYTSHLAEKDSTLLHDSSKTKEKLLLPRGIIIT